MADCKACGAFFGTATPQELCPTCERALKRLKGYAVPVVRCKDCKWYQKSTDDELSRCLHPSGYVGEGMGSLFHCCMGEQKGGD